MQPGKETINAYLAEIQGKTAQEILQWAWQRFGREHVALASSMGAEDQVLTDMLLHSNPQAQIFTLDTGRLPQETYDVIAETMQTYQCQIEVLFPEHTAVERMVTEYGPNLFYDSVENRRWCCRVRKIEPLRRKLTTLRAWICGLRKEQSVTRVDVEKIEWDEANQLLKLNPLSDWNETDVWEYLREHHVPYNTLHDKGYPSIGCAPCTRAIQPGEAVRAGRWYWEPLETKECGLHW